MTDSAPLPLAGSRRPGTEAGPGTDRHGRGDLLLGTVAALFTLAQLVLVRPGMGLGWDETVYVSQVGTHAPAAFFSAPRARGVSLLVAPVASWSSSTALLRIYLAVLSGAALYGALRSWRGLFPARVLALAGALFATLWVTLFYGPQVMPNYWVAVGALAAVGCFLRVRADRRDRGAWWGLAASGCLMAWMRPMDAVWVVLPLCVLALVRRWWRPLAALMVGLVGGSAEWVVEAYTRYGGPARRLAEGSDIQGGLGWHLAAVDQLRSLGGRSLCRPCSGTLPGVAVTVWWYALPPLAALGLAVAVRDRRTTRTLVPLACAASAAFPYLFLIGYAAPRFLLPAYALLALPIADALLTVTGPAAGRWRPVTVTVVAAALAAHLAVQYEVLHRTVRRTTATHRDWSDLATALHRLGVRPPCLLTGPESIPIAYYAGCSSASVHGHNANTTRAAIVDAAREMPVAALAAPDARRPDYAQGWRVHRVGDVTLYIAPGASGAGG
ncbi:hypothetical protein [Streptomyces sp. NPDC087294]|uniref:hypothetical protein n=1 Tax=Streptomyces sp. NPDC087294 TaxID=3365777 RepID=UPI00380B451D